MKNFDNFLIIRLTALVGKHLKKNILFDIKNKFQLDKINKNSVYQYYPIDNLSKDIKKPPTIIEGLETLTKQKLFVHYF